MTRKITLLSDLHLEFGDMTLPGGDILVLAGDIAEAGNVEMSKYNPDYVALPHEKKLRYGRPDRYQRFFAEECPKYNEVIYVVGNHEHYNFVYDNTVNYLKDQLKDIPNIHVLERETYQVDDILFVGSTLWTDMNKADPVTMNVLENYMNDYRRVSKNYLVEGVGPRTYTNRLRPEVIYRAHKDTMEWLQGVVEDPAHADKKIVVVGHHAPTKLSIKPEYEDDHYVNGGYSSDLSDFIIDHPQIKYWVHGHTHSFFDYMMGETRVIANPRGYTQYEERANEIDLSFGFEL